MRKLLLVLAFLLSFVNTTKASHAAGGELTYSWISDSTYKITLKFYRDCSGILEPTTITCGYYNITNGYNIQYYKPKAGFKQWHSERSLPKNSKRLLVFMTYLNDVEDGGTEFKYQNITSPAKKGLTLLWPVDWTHTHRGQISKTNEKYIVTGWLSFENTNEEKK